MTKRIDLGLIDGRGYILNENDILEISKKSKNEIVFEVKSALDAFNGYEGFEDILGLCVDYENKMFTRLAGATGLNAGTDFDGFPMYGGMKRCNVEDNGTISAFYGDADYADDGSNGQVMVYVPKFYYQVLPLKLEKIENGKGYHICKASYFISNEQYPKFKLHPAFYDEKGNEVDCFLYSAYEGSITAVRKNTEEEEFVDETTMKFDDYFSSLFDLNKPIRVHSVVNQKPVSGQSTNFKVRDPEIYCSNRGVGWHCESIKSLSALQFLMMIEYGSLNIQESFEMGISGLPIANWDAYQVNCASQTGSTSVLGNQSGRAEATKNKSRINGIVDTQIYTQEDCVAVSYRGIENPYGNIGRYILGLKYSYDGEQRYSHLYCNLDMFKNDVPENYEDIGFSVIHSGGYISAFGYGSEKYDWLFVASKYEGTSILPVGDCSMLNVTNSFPIEYYNVFLRSGWNLKEANGLFPLKLYSQYGGWYETGYRLIYIPQN